MHHQFTPPEIVKYFAQKKKNPKGRYKLSRGYHNEMWQMGVLMYGLMFPEYSFPFETNREYRDFCLSDLEKTKELSSKRILSMGEYNTIYTPQLIDIV